MIASDHTQAMLDWWAATGVDRVDLAVRRPTGAMLWQRDRALDALPIAWARAENVQHADVYVRPARGHAWPLVFVDDVGVDRAQALAREVDILLVETSPAGGCHVWLHCDRVLAEHDRMHAQRGWIATLDADPGSVSGEHLGRLAGFKNWKRGPPHRDLDRVSHMVHFCRTQVGHSSAAAKALPRMSNNVINRHRFYQLPTSYLATFSGGRKFSSTQSSKLVRRCVNAICAPAGCTANPHVSSGK